MQQEIRTTPKEHFQDLDRFISFKEEGRLQEADAVARHVLNLIDNEEIGNGDILDIREMNTYIYFVRHAISPFSPDNERNRGLSEQGQNDAVLVAEILKSEGIEVIVSSTFARAVDTVRPLANLLNKEYGYDFWKQTSKPDIYKLKFEGTRLAQVESLWKIAAGGEIWKDSFLLQ